MLQKLKKTKELFRKKMIVYITCTMRSGSTLLKSLLANAPDVSHLPEIDFQKYVTRRYRLNTLSTKRIIVLKKPAPFSDRTYPVFPQVKNFKIIILVRDVAEVTISIKKMLDSEYPQLAERWNNEALICDYWFNTYQQIIDKVHFPSDTVTLVRYEDLVANPIKETERLFKFIGSEQTEGVNTYAPPDKYEWKWGNDDGGKKIKSLVVSPSREEHFDAEIHRIINSHDKISQLRSRFGYV